MSVIDNKRQLLSQLKQELEKSLTPENTTNTTNAVGLKGEIRLILEDVDKVVKFRPQDARAVLTHPDEDSVNISFNISINDLLLAKPTLKHKRAQELLESLKSGKCTLVLEAGQNEE